MVWVNEWFQSPVQVPHGGVKHSGIGREQGMVAFANYLQAKDVAIRLPSLKDDGPGSTRSCETSRKGNDAQSSERRAHILDASQDNLLIAWDVVVEASAAVRSRNGVGDLARGRSASELAALHKP
jgi:hypothetical protein